MATIEQVISNNLYIPTGLKKLLRISEEYTDNNVTMGTVQRITKKPIHRKKINPIPKYTKLLVNAKSYPNKIKSIKELYGNITLIEDGVQLIAPKLAENGGSVPLTIRSNVKFKSIALFIKSGNGEPHDYNSSFDKGLNVSCGEGGKLTLISQWFCRL